MSEYEKKDREKHLFDSQIKKKSSNLSFKDNRTNTKQIIDFGEHSTQMKAIAQFGSHGKKKYFHISRIYIRDTVTQATREVKMNYDQSLGIVNGHVQPGDIQLEEAKMIAIGLVALGLNEVVYKVDFNHYTSK